jgi:hypothetical protein
MNILLTH